MKQYLNIFQLIFVISKMFLEKFFKKFHLNMKKIKKSFILFIETLSLDQRNVNKKKPLAMNGDEDDEKLLIIYKRKGGVIFSHFFLHLILKNRTEIIRGSLKNVLKHVMNMRKGWFVVIKIFAPDFTERMFCWFL